MAVFSLRALCWLFCCPPCPSYIAANMAFFPPEPTYSVDTDANGATSLNLTERANWEDSEQELDAVEVFNTKSIRGNKVGCMFIRCAPNSQYTLLYSHGNAVDLGDMCRFYIRLGSFINCNVLSYDYSGYGVSSGKPSEKNLYADIEAAWQVLRHRYGVTPENIILYGESIGTVPTVDLAARFKCAGVILHSPLMSGLRVAFPNTCKTYCFNIFHCCDAFSSIDKVSKVASPVLVIHGTEDKVIDFSHGLAMFERCPHPVEPLFVEGAGHNNIVLYTQYLKRLKQFISSELSTSTSPAAGAASPAPNPHALSLKMDDDSESMEEEPSCARTRCRRSPARSISSSSSVAGIKDEPDDSAEEDPRSSVCMSCSHCKKTLVEGLTVYQRKRCPDLFCSAPCLSAANPAANPPKKECHNCFKLIERPQDLIVAPVDDKGTTKAFCSNTCLSSFNHKRTIINKIALQTQPLQPRCSVCNRHCISKHELTLDDVVHKMCSDDCYVRFRTAKNLTVSYCANCDSYCFNNIITLNLNDGNRTLCSDECLTTFKQRVKTPSTCAICKTYRQTSDMFDVKNGGNVALLCTKSCVMAYKIQAASVSDVPYPCDNCRKTTLPAYHVALSNESIKNFCSLPCAMSFQTSSLKAVATNAPPPPSSSSSCKIMKNKALLCKPMVQDVGVSCTTQVVNIETQTDDYFPRVIVLPVPFPVLVPVPVNLFTSKPFSLPVQECPEESRLPKMDNGPTTSILSGKDQLDDVAALNSEESCGGDYLPDSARYSDSESISENIAEEISAKGTEKESWKEPYEPDAIEDQASTSTENKKLDDTAAFSSEESFSGDYIPDSALYSDSETLINKQKLPCLENTPTVSKSFDDLLSDNETMDSGNERDSMLNLAPRSTSPPQKRSRGRPPKTTNEPMPNPAQKRSKGRSPKRNRGRPNDPMANPSPKSTSPPQKRSRGRPPKKNPEDTAASSSEESGSEEYMPDSEPEPCNDSDSSSSLSAIDKQRFPRLRKSTINKRLPHLRKERRVTESVGGKILTEKNIVPQEQHTFTTKNYCYVCGQAKSKIARHLEKIHKKTEPDVAKAFSFRKNSKERRRLLDILRNRGNHKHNQEVLHKKSGILKLKRKPVKKEKPKGGYLTCPYCKAMFIRCTLWRHTRTCRSKPDGGTEPGRTNVLGIAVLAQSKLNSQHSPETLKVLEAMRQDEVAVAVQNDVHILELAQDLCAKDSNDPNKVVPEYIRGTLRVLGRLVLAMKKKESLFSIADAVKPNSVDKVIEAMKEVSGFDEKKQSYQRPTLAFQLERGLMKISDIILSRTKAADDEQAVEEVQKFQQVFSSRWAEHAPQGTLPTQVIKPPTIPFTHDVQLLYKYLQMKAAEAIESLKKEDSPKTYATLAKVTLAQISIFNKLPTSEISKMTLESFMERDQAEDHTDTAGLLSELEQKLGTHFSRVDMIFRGIKVAALLTSDVCSAVMLLVKKRIACEVYESNPFVFARPKCHKPYRGQDGIRIYASECGAQNPEFLRSRHFRKHVGTLFQILNLQNNELCHLGTFFDCDIRADRDFYQLPEAALEIAKISRLVQAMELGHLKEFQGKSLDELEIDDLLEPDMARNLADNSGDEGEDEESDHPLQLKGKRTRMDLTQAEPTTSPQEEPSTSTGQAKHMEALDALQVAPPTQLNKRPLTVPFTQDVQLLYRYLQKKAAEALESLKREDSPQTYSELAKVTLSQIIIFNKLHASEVSEMTIKDFMERTWAEVHDTDAAFVLSEFEQKLCTHFSRVDITCKSGGKVAVLLNPEVDTAVMLLVKKRVTCDVYVSNPLLFFPPTGHGHYNGQNCIKTFASECGAQSPECLRSRYFRKHVGTLFHILNLKNYELCKLATLLGCSIRADRDFYQLPEAALEMAKISKLVQEMEHGYLWKFQGKSLDELEIVDEMEPDLAWDTANNGDDEGEDEESVKPVQLKAKHTETLDEVTSSRDRKQKKTKWTEKEVNAVMKHFKVHISKCQLASVIESRQCRDAEYKTLKGRTVQNIRDFVRNRGIMLKRSK